MAARFVGESFLNSLLDLLFDKLVSPVVVNLIQRKELKRSMVERLQRAINTARAVLSDAEKRQIKEGAVKDWLDSLKDVVYEADDLLDEVSTKAATQRDPGTALTCLLILPGISSVLTFGWPVLLALFLRCSNLKF